MYKLVNFIKYVLDKIKYTKMFEWFRRRKKLGEKVGSVYVNFEHKTNFKFLIPIFERMIKTIIAHDKRLHHFNILFFVLEDGRTYFKKKQKELLHQMLLNPQYLKSGGYVLGKEVKIFYQEFHVAHATVHIVVDTILADLIELHAPRLIKQISENGFAVNAAAEREIMYLVNSYLHTELPKVITHELTHAIHYLRNTLSNRVHKIKEKSILTKLRIIKKARELEHIEHALDYSKYVAEFRVIIEYLLYGIYTEGIATYFERIMSDDNFIYAIGNEQFDTIYRHTYETSYQFFTDLKKSISSLKREKLVSNKFKQEVEDAIKTLTSYSKSYSYGFGFHMAFTIVYANFPEDKLFDLSIAQFIRIYEKACEGRNVQPLITLSSGKGKLFDYKGTLRMLHRAERAL